MYYDFSGVVEDCIYHSKTDDNFPAPLVSFALKISPTDRQRLFIESQNHPPILNGHYVKGRAYERNLCDGTQKVRIVTQMHLLDKEGGITLATYGS